MIKQLVTRWVPAVSLVLAGVFGSVSAAQAAVVVSFDPAYGAAIPNLGFKGTATLEVAESCYTVGGGFFSMASASIVSAGCTIFVQSAHIDFYNFTQGPGSVFASTDLVGPYLGIDLAVTGAFFDAETQELIGIDTNDSPLFGVNLVDNQPEPGNSVNFAGLMVLYFETGFFTPGAPAPGNSLTAPVSATGVGGARLSTCSVSTAAPLYCDHSTTSNLASSTFTNLGTVPEPGSLALAGVALAALALARRRTAPAAA